MKRMNSIPRILISLLGLALMGMGVASIALGFAGAAATAVVTSIRREGGERTDGKPGRYTYSIGYTFTLPDGKEIHGFSRKIGDSVYVKPTGSTTARVRYFPSMPYVNALEKDTALGAGQAVLIISGALLLFLMNGKTNKQAPRDG